MLARHSGSFAVLLHDEACAQMLAIAQAAFVGHPAVGGAAPAADWLFPYVGLPNDTSCH